MELVRPNCVSRSADNEQVAPSRVASRADSADPAASTKLMSVACFLSS